MHRVIIAVLTSIFILVNAPVTSADQHQKFTDEQKQQIKTIVHKYLLNNPDILKQMAQKLRQQQEQEDQAQASKAISQNAKAIFHNDQDPVLGNPKGNITLVEFMDYQCPHCQDMLPVVNKLIKNNDQLRVVVKQMPVYSQTSYYAAVAALAAKDQGHFAKFHKLLFQADDLDKSMIYQLAKQAGLNVKRLKKQMQQDQYKKHIKDTYQLAQKLGLRGTPAFIIGTDGQNAIYIPEGKSYKQMQTKIDKIKKQQ